MDLQQDIYYNAFIQRDSRFDGTFFVGVKTTGIYCRPVCTARKPFRKNIMFFHTASAAEESSFRPCKRCHPELAPFNTLKTGSEIVDKAINAINQDTELINTVNTLVPVVQISERQLHRYFIKHLSTSPTKFITTHKLNIASQMLHNSNLPVTEIAFASGFNSIRNFNDAFKKRFNLAPRDVRRKNIKTQNSIIFYIPVKQPYDWNHLLSFLQIRAVQGIEYIHDGVYERLLSEEGINGIIKVSYEETDSRLKLELQLKEYKYILKILNKIKQLFDVDFNPEYLSEVFSNDKNMSKILSDYPGTRIPGAWSAYELTIRAILGQQVTIKAATTFMNRFIQKYGTLISASPSVALNYVFPQPSEIAKLQAVDIGIPTKRGQTIIEVSKHFANNTIDFSNREKKDKSIEILLSVKGIGKWTTEYITMRVYKDTNAWLEGDLILKQVMQKLDIYPQHVDNWQPLRAYAAMLLWRYSSKIKN